MANSMQRVLRLFIGPRDTGYLLPEACGLPGEVLTVEPDGTLSWKKLPELPKIPEPEFRMFSGRTAVKPDCDTIIVKFDKKTRPSRTDYIVTGALVNGQDASNIPAWIVTKKRIDSFEVVLSERTKGKSFTFEWVVVSATGETEI